MYSTGVPSRASDAGPENATGGLPMVFCLDCDERIPAKRLKAVPDAEYCVRCQPDHERSLDMTNLTLAEMGDLDLSEVLR